MQDALLSALEQGALLLTANRRLARHWRQNFDAARQAAGASVWQAPLIRTWPDWVNESIDALLPDRVTPSDFTERRGWLKIVGDAPLLDRQATAASAAQAWALCQQYQLSLHHPGFADAEDTARFRDWALAFEQRVEKNHWLPAARRELWLAEVGQLTGREVWLDGFDEVTPAQQLLLSRLRTRRYDAPAPPAAAVTRRGYPDARAEIEAAACWARTLLEDGAARSVGIVVQHLAALRPAVEAAFEDILGRPLFNISLGRPLAEWPVIADALLWLRWLGAPIEAGSAGVLLRSPFLAGAGQERGARALFDIELRNENLLEVTASRARAAAPPLLAEAIGRALTLFRAQPRQLSPGAWARVIPELLAAGGWPGSRTQSSAERQALARWQSLLREFAALDLVEGPVPFSEALSMLAGLAGEAIFQPETEEMPVQILEALQAAGSSFDALWVMGLTDTQWPPPARPHPFLPRVLQRELDLPHATPERELRFARDVTARLVRSAPVVVFSHPHRDGDEQLRPSRLIAGYPDEAPPSRTFPGYAIAAPLEESVDRSAPPLPEGERVRGGTTILAWQSQCPFRAFAAVRLRAEEWAEPEPGLSPLERGTALHAALAALWKRFGSRAELARATSAERFAAIREAARTGCAELSRDGRDNLVALEQQRVEAVLEDWIELDCERGDFTVEAIEKEVDLRPAGLPLRARADRIDRLPGGERILIDYKSTAPGRKVWAGERPDNLQLPLYAVALPETPSAIVFAQMKRGEHKFDGLAADAGLLPGVKPPPQGWQQQLEDWREVINRIWAEFQSGRADVDPKDGGKPCAQCHLHSLCRVYDTSLHPAADDADSANP
jgi:ATP-dependent helicase/nuclease subunit B